jgi:predicted transposase YbfD/YdcC
MMILKELRIMKKNIFELFEEIEDPRIEKKTRHNLVDIISIAVCGVIVGSETFEDIEIYGLAKLDWFRSYLELRNGIPSHDTFRRIFSLINPEQFERIFSKWVKSVFCDERFDQIAIDGKTLRGSQSRQNNRSAIHIVNAFCTKNKIVLSQKAVEDKSGEKTALPSLIEGLNLTDTLVSIDAGACYTDVAKQISEKGGDYLLALKGNQKTSHNYAIKHFETMVFSTPANKSAMPASLDEFDDGHGRTVRRRVFVSDINSENTPLSKWPDISRLLAVETISTRGQNITTSDIRYYISNSNREPKSLSKSIQNHWAIENSLHWVLDVTFNEDRSRIRDEVAAQNMSALRKFAINILRKETSKKISIKAKQKLAGWSDNYMLNLIKLF